MAWSIVGDGSIGSPSAHIRSFQLSQSSLSACRIRASPLARVSADCAARMLVIARALPSSLCSALRSPPERGVGWCFGAIRTSGFRQRHRRSPATTRTRASSRLLRDDRSGCWQVSSNRRCPTSFQTAVWTVEANGVGLLDFDGPAAAGAGHPQNMLGNFGQPQRPDRWARRHRAGVGERVA